MHNRSEAWRIPPKHDALIQIIQLSSDALLNFFEKGSVARWRPIETSIPNFCRHGGEEVVKVDLELKFWQDRRVSN